MPCQVVLLFGVGRAQDVEDLAHVVVVVEVGVVILEVLVHKLLLNEV